MQEAEYNLLTGAILGCAIEVHKSLGPGLLESIYETCLIHELQSRRLTVERQVCLPVNYKGVSLDKVFFIDLLVENEIVMELKSVEAILPIHEAQLLTYLKLSGKKLGMLINFNVPVLRNGIRRKINGRL